MLSAGYCRSRSTQGVALISVLIVVALVSATATWLMRSQHIAIERTAQIIDHEQGRLQALSVEFVVLNLLRRDKENKVDYYTTPNPVYSQDEESDDRVAVDENQELWSRQWEINAENFEDFGNLEDIKAFEERSWSICMNDVSGLININMVHQGLQGSLRTQTYKDTDFHRSFFLALFKQADLGPENDLDPPTAEKLWDTLQDWFDSDDDPRLHGAESSEYLYKDPPYIPSGRPMIWPEEIYLVHQFEQQTIRGFVDYLVALPNRIDSSVVDHKINLNTAPIEVLSALPGINGGNIGKAVLAELDRRRRSYGEEPFDSVTVLCGAEDALLISTGWCNKDSDTGEPFWSSGAYERFLGVKSQLVQAVIKVKSGTLETEMQSLISRVGDPKVLQRRFGSGYYRQCLETKRGVIKGQP